MIALFEVISRIASGSHEFCPGAVQSLFPPATAV
jgi:hypothetical protein